MNKRRYLAFVLLALFLPLTIYAVMQVGYVGIFDYQRHSPAGWQVFADLVVALVLVFTWMIPEARRNGRNPWPWVIMTLFLGSIGPLLYMAFTRTENQQKQQA